MKSGPEGSGGCARLGTWRVRASLAAALAAAPAWAPAEEGAGASGSVAAGAPDASSPSTAPRLERPLWELGLGLGALSLPHYRGSDQSHTWVLPVPLFVYRGTIFKADREGARAVLLDTQALDLDVSVGAGAPTRSADNLARAGMPNLAPTFEIGPNLNWTLATERGWRLQLRLPVRAAYTLQSRPRDIGWVTSPNLSLDLRGPYAWNFGLLAGPVFGSRRFNQYTYEVPAAYATPDRAAYSARSGAAGGQFIAAMSQRSGQRWTGLFLKFDTLRGASFVDSPLVRRRQAWSAGVAMSWALTTSSQTVMVKPEAP